VRVGAEAGQVAYCVNVAAPWDHDTPLRRLVIAVVDRVDRETRAARRRCLPLKDQGVFWQIHRATIVNLHAIARVERDWRDQPVITLKSRPEKLTVSRTFAHRFKAM
jgi:DNA-binding LytR/AlgR family response regulator